MLEISKPRAKNQHRRKRPESVGQSNIVETLASFQVLPQFYKRNECPKLLSFYIAILNPECPFSVGICKYKPG